MKIWLTIVFVFTTSLLVACNSTEGSDIKNTGPVPAILTMPSDEDRMTLKWALARLLHQDSVVIAYSAFVSNSTLVLERTPRLDAQGHRVQGRELQMPERVQLLLSGDVCILKRLSTGETVALKTLNCSAESP